MDPHDELGAFLKTRRARISPAEVGLRDYGERRRVPGLRREELAMLAGVSVDYYVRLEQGRARGVSEEVLGAIADALRLDADERDYVSSLARPARQTRTGRPSVRPQVRVLLDAMHDVPAYVVDHRSDILAWNPLAAALILDFGALPRLRRNWAVLCFLDERTQEIFPEWSDKAREVVAQLRLNAARHPDDRRLAALVGELSVKSEQFRTWWADRNVREKTFGIKRFRNPSVGELTLTFESLNLTGDADQTIVAYCAEPGSASATALRLLAGLTASSNAPAAPGANPTVVSADSG